MQEEFILCRITRKWDNQHGVLATDEDESRQQLVSPIQLSSRDSRNPSEENILTNPQQLPNHNLISDTGNHIEQNIPSFPRLIPNVSLISSNHLNSDRNYREENILPNQIEEDSPTNPQLPPNSNSNSFPVNLIEQHALKYPHLLPNHNLIYSFGNQIEQNSPTNPQLSPNSNLISFPGNLIELNTPTHPQLIPNHGLISPTLLLQSDHLISKQNLSEENSLKSLDLQPNHNLISNFGNQIKVNSATNPQLPPNSNFESQLLLNQPMVTHDFAEFAFQEEHLPPGEFYACSSSNRRNNDSFSAMQTPIYQGQELIYSNCSFDNCDLSDCQIDSEQVSDLFQRAFQDEISGQTLASDLNSSKSDGGASAYAEDSSDTNNTAYINAWVNELLQDVA